MFVTNIHQWPAVTVILVFLTNWSIVKTYQRPGQWSLFSISNTPAANVTFDESCAPIKLAYFERWHSRGSGTTKIIELGLVQNIWYGIYSISDTVCLIFAKRVWGLQWQWGRRCTRAWLCLSVCILVHIFVFLYSFLYSDTWAEQCISMQAGHCRSKCTGLVWLCLSLRHS